MNASREGLLRPTLSQETRLAAAPYSVQTTFFTAFFGGPFAAIAILAINSVRLRRVLRDLPVLAATLLLVVGGGWALLASTTGTPAREWLDAMLGKGSFRYVYRLVALVIVGIGYFLHRRAQRNAALLGVQRPNGWIAGAICAIAGTVVLIAFIALVESR